MTTAIVGGLCIGGAAVWLYLSIGRIAGISGIAANALTKAKTQTWAVFFVAGLGVGGWAAYALLGYPDRVPLSTTSVLWLVAGGLLVGFGTRLGSGCTSGHGVCGISRFSVRSLVATVVFLVVGMLVATGLWAVGLK